MNIAIRRATPADWPAIVDINDSAFEGPAESALIGAIERSGRPVISLIAVADGVPAGHIFFSPIRIQSPGPPIRPGRRELACSELCSSTPWRPVYRR